MKKVVVVSLLFGLFVGIIVFIIPRGFVSEQSEETPSISITPEPRTTGQAASIDGTKTLVMKTLPREKGIASYTFLIADDKEEYSIFTKDAREDAFIVPSNSWSPDGMYIFLIDIASLPQQVYVFKASGEPFSDGKKYLNVTELFAVSKPQQVLDTATGWDSRGLLHLRTKNQDDTRGPSFWFDVDSRSFIQLAAR